MRIFLLALALIACSPAAPPAAEDDRAAHAGDAGEAQPANPDAAALGAAPVEGSWTLRTDEGVTGAGFGPPESEYLLTIACETPTGKISLIYEHELAPDQNTTLRIITPVQTLDLPARSFNEGLPSVTADVLEGTPAKTALISMLGAPADRFAVEVNGEISVFPWADEVSQALIACR
ncbi:MAG: hypothetical protein JNL81_03115 [Hyphomonadaceae bacterium]|nr:hypothetical protein [Hyphomonadaceae bacterium]